MNRYVKVREIDVVHGLTRWVSVDDIAGAGPPGPPSVLQDDLDPTLGADLKLNSHAIVGELETETLVIDGGLL